MNEWYVLGLLIVYAVIFGANAGLLYTNIRNDYSPLGVGMAAAAMALMVFGAMFQTSRWIVLGEG